jgi:copper/silver efflux system protein
MEQRLNTRGDISKAIQSGAGQRIRPMLMTGLSSFIGLVPILFTSCTGADVMQRIAAPMLGCVVSALLMVLVVFPAIFMFWRGRGLPAVPPRPHGTITTAWISDPQKTALSPRSLRRSSTPLVP